jgi:hypothetical protein
MLSVSAFVSLRHLPVSSNVELALELTWSAVKHDAYGDRDRELGSNLKGHHNNFETIAIDESNELPSLVLK